MNSFGRRGGTESVKEFQLFQKFTGDDFVEMFIQYTAIL
jgi:hypothetical protein